LPLPLPVAIPFHSIPFPIKPRLSERRGAEKIYPIKKKKKNMDDEHVKKHILKIITINVLFSSARA
jgi:hypothetical protein